MPFTPAHAAIVLPFLKIDHRYVSATALIAGSVAPDFEYFLKFSVDGKYGHTIPGIFYFDIPIVFLLSFLFHLVVKDNFIGNLPSFFQARLQLLREMNFFAYLKKHPVTFVVSAALGAASHIFWDSFTHNGAYFVRTLPFYRGAFFYYDGVDYPLWYALQHISTFVGLTIVSIYIVLMSRSKQWIYSRPDFLYWVVLLLLSAGITGLRFLIKSSDYSLGNFVVTCISAICLSLIISGLIKFRNRPITV